MATRDYLIAKFSPEKGPAIRAIVQRFDYLFHHKKWGKDGDSVKLEADISGPDSDDEGSRTRFLYDVEEVQLLMGQEGAIVEPHIAELAR